MKSFNISGYLSRLFLLVLVGMLCSLSTARAQEADVSFYVVNLESSLRVISLTGVLVAEEGQVYLTDFEKDGQVWHRVRLGFFASEEQAELALERVKSHYPSAWVARASRGERDRVVAGLLKPNQAVSAPQKRRTQPVITPLSPPDGFGLDPALSLARGLDRNLCG